MEYANHILTILVILAVLIGVGTMLTLVVLILMQEINYWMTRIKELKRTNT